MRGIGGIFFDHLNGSEEQYFNLVHEVGEEFLNAYMPLVDRRINEEWNDEDVEFQYYRRGRYVEFLSTANLVLKLLSCKESRF